MKDCDEFKGVFISPDYTKAKQAQQYELRQELRSKERLTRKKHGLSETIWWFHYDYSSQ